MKYFKTKNSNGSVDFGCCEVYMPVGSIEISEEEYNALVVDFEENKQPEEEQWVNDLISEVAEYEY